MTSKNINGFFTWQKARLPLTLLILLNLFVYFSETTLITDEMMYETLIAPLDPDTAIKQMEKMNSKWFLLLKYFSLGIWILLKLGGITLILMLGFFAFNIKTNFVQIFQAIHFPAFVFLIPDILKIIWFSLVQTDYRLADLNNFPRFSMSDLLVLFDFGTSERFAALLKRILQPIGISNLLFCWTVGLRAKEIIPDNKNVFTAVFISYFSVLIALNLALHGIITLIKP